MEQINQVSFFPLLVVSALAFFVPLAVARLRSGLVPIVVGEILAGIVFGQAGLDLVRVTDIVDFLAFFGFAYLMFLSGLEVDFGLLSGHNGSRHDRRVALLDNPLAAGVIIFLLTTTSASLVARFLTADAPLSHTLLVGLILSTTSVGIVVPILRERGLTRIKLGQTILMAALVADLVTISLITLLASLGDDERVLQGSLVLVLVAAFVVATRVSMRLGRVRIVRATLEELAHATAQIQVRGSLALMVVFVALAQAIGAELILGSFLAGAVISSVSREEGSSLRLKLEAIGYGFFVPFFFITVGATFDLDALQSSPRALLLVPMLITAAYGVKIVPSLILAVRYPISQAFATGVLLSSRLSLIIAASVIGLRLGVIDEATNAALILVAVVTSILSPALFAKLYPRTHRQQNRVVIVGAGEVGRLLARRLAKEGREPVLVETNPDVAEKVRSEGFRVVTGSGISTAVLEEAGAMDASAFVAVTGDGDLNREACVLARDMFGLTELFARAVSPPHAADSTAVGIVAVTEPLALAIALDNLLMRPDIFQVLAAPSRDSEVVEVLLRNRRLAGHQVGRMRLPGDAMVVLVQRGGRNFVPHPETVLELGDLVTIAGDREAVEATGVLLQGEGEPNR